MISDAVLSDDGLYRYRLERAWGDTERTPFERGTVTWVMLNPSIASHSIDDPTLNRCLSFSRRAGMGRLLVVNLYALRSTDPATLTTHPDPVGPENLAHVSNALSEAQLIVAAWGAHPMALRSTTRLKLRNLAPPRAPVVCLGKAGQAQPRHPGRIAASTLFLPFELP